jgi:hypothetical protein
VAACNNSRCLGRRRSRRPTSAVESLATIAATIRVQMKRPQESSLNHSAKAGMRNRVATAIRAMPLRCLTDPLHRLNSRDQLPDFSISFACRSFASNGSLSRLEQSNSTAQEIFEFAILVRDLSRRFQRSFRPTDCLRYPVVQKVCLELLTGE